MSANEPPPPPPLPPPPPPGYQQAPGTGYQQSYGLPTPTRVVPPAPPEIDPALIRPSKAWYWIGGGIGGILLVASTVLSVINEFDNFGGEADLGLVALSWLLYIVGGGIAAIVGGITWSRRNEHKRRLQREELARQGVV